MSWNNVFLNEQKNCGLEEEIKIIIVKKGTITKENCLEENDCGPF